MLNEILLVFGPLIGVIIGGVMGYFLEKKRDRINFFLNKKVEIYSKILVKLNTVFQDERRNIIDDPNFKNKIRLYLAEIICEGRLLAGATLEEKLRDYYDIAIKWWSMDKKEEEYKKISDKMDILVIQIEQLMREEVGSKRILSDKQIERHVKN